MNYMFLFNKISSQMRERRRRRAKKVLKRREEIISDMHMTYIILLFLKDVSTHEKEGKKKRKLFYILFVVAFKTPFAVNFLLPSHALDKMKEREKRKK